MIELKLKPTLLLFLFSYLLIEAKERRWLKKTSSSEEGLHQRAISDTILPALKTQNSQIFDSQVSFLILPSKSTWNNPNSRTENKKSTWFITCLGLGTQSLMDTKTHVGIIFVGNTNFCGLFGDFILGLRYARAYNHPHPGESSHPEGGIVCWMMEVVNPLTLR